MFRWFSQFLASFGKPDITAEGSFQIRSTKIRLEPCSHDKVFQTWQDRRKTVKGQLVILVDGGPHEEVRTDATEESPQNVLEEAARINATEFIVSRHEELGIDEDDEEEESALNHAMPKPENLVTTNPGANYFSSINANGRYELGVIPCQNPWEVFAWLPFGDWNYVPTDAQLTAVFKSWWDRFGAVPALVSTDVIEFWVDRPVTDPVVACELAMEMFYLCPDIVDQGTETVEALANQILNANVWYFWWD